MGIKHADEGLDRRRLWLLLGVAGLLAVTLAIIAVVLIAGTVRLRKRGAPIHSVEEEFGVEPGGGIRVDADSVSR